MKGREKWEDPTVSFSAVHPSAPLSWWPHMGLIFSICKDEIQLQTTGMMMVVMVMA